MRLTTKTDYCLRVLIYLQENSGKSKIAEIAKAYNISKNHLSVAVNKLSELGYVFSSPGPKGGIEFNPEFAEKTIAELITSLESFDVVECFDAAANKCNLSPRCRLKLMLGKATRSFIDELKEYRIKDLVEAN